MREPNRAPTAAARGAHISSVIFTLITHYYKLILPHYAAIVLSLHNSHLDIAFVVKFKFSEGLSDI